MVRLIRLTSNSNEGIFDNTFKQDIILKEKSKIALKSLSVEVDTSVIEINSSNDNINFQLADTGPTPKGIQNVQLTHGTYDAINSNLLFHDMNVTMNAALDTSSTGENRDIGVEVKNSINSGSTKFECEFKIVKLDEYFNDMVFNKGPVPVLTGGTGVNHNFKGPAAINPPQGDCFFYNKINMCKGGGVFRIRRKIISAETGTHAIIGFMNSNPDELPNNTKLDINNIVFGIVVGGSSLAAPAPPSIYKFIENGVISAAGAGVLCETNDIIEIGISEGDLISRVWKVGGMTEVNTKQYNFNNLFPVVIIEKIDTDITFEYLRYTPNPFIKNQIDIVPLIDDFGVGATPPTQGGSNNPTNHFLEFESDELSNFLGFKYNRIPQVGFRSTSKFIATANRIFKPNNLSDAFILEMLNIGLDSYDGELQSRASYLAVIPKEDKDSIIIYDTPYPIYININNFQPLTLRNIRCRLLNNDLSPVKMLGLGTIVVLLE